MVIAGEYVLTNWHVVLGRSGNPTVTEADGTRYSAKVIETDRLWDLAVLSVPGIRAPPVEIETEAPRVGDWATVHGYGGGSYHVARGLVLGYDAASRKAGNEFLVVRVNLRPGDSGSPILNARGRLIGVAFGHRDGKTWGAFCGRVRKFLARVRQDQPAQPNLPKSPPSTVPQFDPSDLIARIEALNKQTELLNGRIDASESAWLGEALNTTQSLEELTAALKASGEESEKAETEIGGRIDSLVSLMEKGSDRDTKLATDVATSMGHFVSRLDALQKGIAPEALAKVIGPLIPAAPAWLAPAAIGGPAGVAGIIGWTALSALWRRRKRKAGQERQPGYDPPATHSETKPTPPPAPPEPPRRKPFREDIRLPREEQEAVELLQLSQAEGRDPLHDALIGRLAFDELDNEIEGGTNGRAEWARELKTKLEGKFNKIMPLAVT